MALPTAPVAAGSLVGGYLVAAKSGNRRLGGGVLLGAAAWLTRSWRRDVGTPAALGLLATYLGGFGGSHPLAKKIGAWPSVLAVAAVSGIASWLVADRRG